MMMASGCDQMDLCRVTAWGAVAIVSCLFIGTHVYEKRGKANTLETWPGFRRSVPRRLPEHIGEVWGLAFSPDGKLLATETDGPVASALIWDTSNWQIVRRIPEPRGDGITCLAFSPDSQLLALSVLGEPIDLWEVATGKLVHSLKGHMANTHLAFSPDGKTLAAASIPLPVIFWDVRSGQEIRRVEGCSPVSFSPDGKLFAAGSASSYNEVTLWSTSSWQPTITLKGHYGSVESVQFSPDSKMVATGSMDGTARLWDPQTGKQLRRLGSHRSSVFALSFSPNGKMLATADWRVYLWNPATGRRIGTLEGAPPTQAFATNVVDFSPDNRFLAAGRKHVVEIWDLKK